MASTRHIIAYALVAFGALWLLIEIGFVPPRLTSALLEWWPLLLVGLGLDFVLPDGKRGPLPITVYAAAAILVIALFGISSPSAVTEQEFERPLPPQATSLTALIELGSARSSVGPADPGVAVDAEFQGPQPSKVDLTGTTDLQLEIRRGRGSFLSFRRAEWEIELAPSLPTALDIRSGSGAASLNLSRFDLTALSLGAGSGSTDLTLPGGGRLYSADISSGSGRLGLAVGSGASLDLTLQTRSGSVHLDVGDSTDLQLTLATGSGAVTIDLPDDSPIRIQILDDGSGRVNVPRHLDRRSGSGDTGVWQSATFERGGRVIDVTVVDVGSGSITFR